MRSVTILIPAYNEEKQLPVTIDTVLGVFEQEVSGAPLSERYQPQLLFVDDGSRDGTWEVLRAAAARDSRVTALHFARNFGKEIALTAGLAAAHEAGAEAVIVMDADLQHPPASIPEMLRLWEEGYEVVEGVKEARGTGDKLGDFLANGFYGLFHSLSGLNLRNQSDFKLLDQKVVATLAAMSEHHPFFRAKAAWVGFKRSSFSFTVGPRQIGSSKWSGKKLFRLALDAILGFSSKPLQLLTLGGIGSELIFLLLAILMLCGATPGLLASPIGPSFWAGNGVLLLAFFLGLGILLLGLSMLGLYISRILDEVRDRPLYIISARLNR